jgi:CRISPR-associated endonuclease/helicase Cas3
LLAYHCLDVAAAAKIWWQQDAALRRLFVRAGGADESRLRAWLLFFVALHDLGKFDARFQWKAPETARLLKPEFEKQLNHSDTTGFNHGAAGYAWFCKEIEAYGFGKDADNALEWMKAVAGHHGGNPEQTPPHTAGFAAPAVLQHDRQARIFLCAIKGILCS